MMKNYDKSLQTNRNPNWPYSYSWPDILYRIVIVGSSGSCKTDVSKIYLYIKDPFESKYQYYEDLEDYNPTRKGKC